MDRYVLPTMPTDVPDSGWDLAQERAFFQEAFGNKSYKRKKHESAASTSVTSDAAAVPSTSTSGTKHIAGKATKHKVQFYACCSVIFLDFHM